jgi:hypothetical protein
LRQLSFDLADEKTDLPGPAGRGYLLWQNCGVRFDNVFIARRGNPPGNEFGLHLFSVQQAWRFAMNRISIAILAAAMMTAGAAAYAADDGVGVGVDVLGVGAGVHADSSGIGTGAHVGPVGAGVGAGDQGVGADTHVGSANVGAGVATHPCVSYDYHDDGTRYCSRYEE